MSRWDTTTHVRDVSRPTNKVVLVESGLASGDLNSQHRVTEHPAGFRVRERGAIDGTVVHQYRCVVHGVFDARVDRADVPEEVACPKVDVAGWCNARDERCGLTAPWAGSLCGQGHSSGEVTC